MTAGSSAFPAIRKASYVHGRTLAFRNACAGDAEFILSLRTDESKARFLSQVSPDVEAQHRWLSDYEWSVGQAYFIIEHQQEAIGTVRLYDARQPSFCWGSWILKQGAPRTAALESALMVYALGCDHLRFERSHFDVRKANAKVWAFHERFGATRVGETDDDYLYDIGAEQILAARRRYAQYLPAGVSVGEWL
jgi:RimJ/RimL family protein N-acetyltransferase